MVTIDGPAGAGKSTVARELARRLSARFLDTGALYRAVTHAALAAGVDPADGPALSAFVGKLDVRQDPDGRTRVNGEVVAEEDLRGAEVTARVSEVAARPEVREALLPVQRALAAPGGLLVCEGRDMGTVVFPRAELKVWLDAELAERARRRGRDLGTGDADEVAREIAARDAQDSGREVAPLARDASQVVVDTTGMPIEGVVDRLLELVRARRPRAGDS